MDNVTKIINEYLDLRDVDYSNIKLRVDDEDYFYVDYIRFNDSDRSYKQQMCSNIYSIVMMVHFPSVRFDGLEDVLNPEILDTFDSAKEKVFSDLRNFYIHLVKYPNTQIYRDMDESLCEFFVIMKRLLPEDLNYDLSVWNLLNSIKYSIDIEDYENTSILKEELSSYL